MMVRMTMWTRALMASVLLMLLLFFNVNVQAQTQAKGSNADMVAQPLRVPPPPPPEEDPPYNYASMYDQSVPTTMTAGAVYTVTVRMLNAGTTAWTSAGSYSLGSSNPLNNGTWGGGRVPLPNTIYPGQVATFTFNVTAPAAAGSYNFQWAMVQDGVGFFGVAGTNLVINVVAPARVNGAVIVAQSVPAQMTTGQSYPVTMVMQNTGNTTWTSADQYSFGLPTVNGVQLWNGGRVPLPGAVPPGGQAAFNFTVTAPAPGSYSFFGLMVQDGVEFFGQGSSIPVNVSAPAPVNGSQLIGISVPPLTSGQVANISVTLQNTGNTTWAAGSNYKLGSKNPDENTIWGVARVELAASVAPGQQYTFTFPITAPAAGTYTMQWQMMERYVQWFGGLASASVPISASPSSDNVVYIHTDALGSPVARSDSAGNVISRTSYEPYGRTASGATPTIGFTGHVNDADTGLVYMQQRYYDPVAGRFLSVDPVVTDTTTGSNFNRYTYANNSPYKFIDPDGRFSQQACDDMGRMNCETFGASATAEKNGIVTVPIAGKTKMLNDSQYWPRRGSLSSDGKTLTGNVTYTCSPPSSSQCLGMTERLTSMNAVTADGHAININVREFGSKFMDFFSSPDIRFSVRTLSDNGEMNQGGLSYLSPNASRFTATHEFGHWIGLNHSADPRSIMYPGAIPGRGSSPNDAEIKMLIDFYKR